MKGKDGGAAKVLRREWVLRRLPRWGRGVRRRTALRALRPSLHLRTEPALQAVPVFRMAYFTIPHRPTFGAPVFRSAYSASRNARASAAFAASIKPHRGLISKTLMLQVRCAHPAPSHRNTPSGHSGVPVGLFYAKNTQYSLLQNARLSGSLRSPYGCLRTVTPLRDIPVLRMAYFTIKPHRGLISKTLMLQVRCAHPTPSHRNAPSGHSGVPVGLFYAKSTQYSLLQNARPPGSLRSPYG